MDIYVYWAREGGGVGLRIEDEVLMRVGMQHSGIGGGGFMLVRDSDGSYESIGTKSLCSLVKLIRLTI